MSLKHFFVTLFACLVLSQAGLRCARAEPTYEITLEDEYGQPLPTFRANGTRYVMGEMGERYNIRVTNRTGVRVEAVVTVDGRDVISGRMGDFKNERGYVLAPYGSVLIEGFRTSTEHVAAFRFSSPGESYSARMGTPQNVGIIGAAFFSEAPRPRPVYRRPMPIAPRRRTDVYREESLGNGRGAEEKSARSASPSPSAAHGYGGAPAEMDSADESASNIGTEFGEQRESEVREVSFRRARPASPDLVLSMRYDDEDGLRARGIETRPWERRRHREPEGPSAFPLNRFASPPPPRRY